ncbi:zinc ribbon domain-containing protein [Candidatus Oleimmundimicrobium sp.]|uniref:FmdB family zinc ribbon protein n=1 Tax=Candidatus Oleimmundimicrobium sp. TaxID=3060597 RepID=UPI00271B6A00|nr:zinc ribbon domain-containing protein [Candidatus Oleimmundimicrobium sp.]MDO8886013.1 zinc ribbon domain-containing protein [Candidatus Oleimmundimicrobium sp.]
MPIFEYRCSKCNKKFELLVGVGKENNDLKCPHCGSKDILKLFSSFGLKGETNGGVASS